MSLQPQGRFKAQLAKQITVYQTKDGALCAAVVCMLENGWTSKKTQTLVKQDDTPNTKVIDEMKDIFGDPFDAENRIYRFSETEESEIADIPGASEISFEVTVEHKQKDDADGNPYTYAEIAWLNKAGGGIKIPDAISRAEVMKKYGAKFRALGVGASKPATAKTETPVKPKTPVAPAKKAPALPSKRKADDPLASTATEEEAFGALVEKFPNADQDEVSAAWWIIARREVGPADRSDNEGLTLKDYGKIKVAFEALDELPTE